MQSTLVTQILIILLLAAVGYIAWRKKVINQSVQTGLSSIVLNISVPASILAASNMPMEKEKLPSIFLTLVAAILFYSLSIVLFRFLARFTSLKEKERTIFSLLGVFQNAAFIGYPVLAIFMPEDGVFYGSFFVATFNILIYTYGISRVSGVRKFSFKTIFFNLANLASVGMLVLFFLQIKLPGFIQETLSLLGGLSTPLSMIVIGSMLASFPLRELFTTPSLYVITALRLFIIPTAVFFLLRALALPPEISTTTLIMSGLPCAATVAIIAEQYNCAQEYASKGVLLSTLFFVISLPYIAFLHSFL